MADVEESTESYEASEAVFRNRVPFWRNMEGATFADLRPGDVEGAMKHMWETFACTPRVSYTHPDVCREFAKTQPERVIRATHSPGGMTWQQIADYCPRLACVVLTRRSDEELTFGYLDCSDEALA